MARPRTLTRAERKPINRLGKHMKRIREAGTDREKLWAAAKFLIAEAVHAKRVPGITDVIIQLARELNREDPGRGHHH